MVRLEDEDVFEYSTTTSRNPGKAKRKKSEMVSTKRPGQPLAGREEEYAEIEGPIERAIQSNLGCCVCI
jgi:hypothetical protein